MRLRRWSISLISSQITSNIFQHIHSIYTLLIQVLSSIITFQFHHRVTKSIHAGDSHSQFSYLKTRPSSLTSTALLLERDTRRPHLARPHSGDQSDRFPKYKRADRYTYKHPMATHPPINHSKDSGMKGFLQLRFVFFVTIQCLQSSYFTP